MPGRWDMCRGGSSFCPTLGSVPSDPTEHSPLSQLKSSLCPLSETSPLTQPLSLLLTPVPSPLGLHLAANTPEFPSEAHSAQSPFLSIQSAFLSPCRPVINSWSLCTSCTCPVSAITSSCAHTCMHTHTHIKIVSAN